MGPDHPRGIHNREETAKPAPLLERGFLLPLLLPTDTALHGRWDYLAQAWETGELPDAPIPRLDFLTTADKAALRMLTGALDAIPDSFSGSWRGWSGSGYFRFFLEWLLYGFRHPGQPLPPEEPAGCEGAGERLLQTFDLSLLLSRPYDYFGDLLAENAYGKGQGFFPTPHPVAELMARMTLGTPDTDGRDTRTLTVCDPCAGTGRLLLHASNYSLRLYGMDIDPLVIQAALVNGYLFAPWLVRPLPFLDAAQHDPDRSMLLSESMTAQAPPHIAGTLADTEHDTQEQWRFEPIKKRRRKDPLGGEEAVKQGVLF